MGYNVGSCNQDNTVFELLFPRQPIFALFEHKCHMVKVLGLELAVRYICIQILGINNRKQEQYAVHNGEEDGKKRKREGGRIQSG